MPDPSKPSLALGRASEEERRMSWKGQLNTTELKHRHINISTRTHTHINISTRTHLTCVHLMDTCTYYIDVPLHTHLHTQQELQAFSPMYTNIHK